MTANGSIKQQDNILEKVFTIIHRENGEIITLGELRAEENLKAKSEFLYHMIHGIRTPMNGVIGLLDLMDGDNLSLEQKCHLELLKAASSGLQSPLMRVIPILN